jgi:hypothetical protein
MSKKKPITLEVFQVHEDCEQFLVSFKRPGRIEVTMIDGQLTVYVWDGTAIDLDQEPLGGFDSSIEMNVNWSA